MATRFVITTAMLLLLLSEFSAAKERTVDEFREYASRRIAQVGDDQLTAFVDSVDKDHDGKITDAEFANRIDIFQRVFKTVQPMPSGGGHALPDNWLTSFEEARETSADTGKPILAMFSASWCGPCKVMIANVYPTDEAKQALKAFVPVYIDSEMQRDLAAKNSIRAFPTFVCFDTRGEAIDQHVGGGGVEEFVEMLAAFAASATEIENESEVPGILAPAADLPKADSRLAYTVKIDPVGRQVHITGTVAGHTREQVTQLASLGLREQVQVGINTDDDLVSFRYQVPIEQATFKDPQSPVLNQDYFAGFMGRILLVPKIDGVDFKDIPLTLEAPEGWKIATSRGVGAARYTLDGLQDLANTLVCAGDYSTHSFDLRHKAGDARTKFHVAIRGERDWDDREFVDEFKRLVRGQMDYFGGSHPAPVQFVALHLLPKGAKPQIPAFNRRAPGHDTVLALHTRARPRRHFEFLGMLAHEHLHNWYPNAMKSDLGPWFMEGLNDYVAYRGLLANGLHTQQQFSGMLSKWHQEYQMCVRTGNQRVMPYRRGMIAAWVFDIEIRRATGGRSGLTDVLLKLIEEQPAGGIVQRRHFLAMLKKVSGKDMEALYRHLVEDDGAVDLAAHLEGTGFRIGANMRAIQILAETDGEKKLLEAILSE